MTCVDFTVDVTETSPSVDVTQPTLSVDVTQPADNTVDITETSPSVNVTQPTFEIDTNQTGATNFIQLTDTPSSYSGQNGKILQVNVGETALEFVDSVSSEWGSITGTLSDQTDLQTALDTLNFIQLTDTPSSYSGQATKALTVNSGEDAIEFTTIVTADEKVKYNTDDASAGFLADKTIAGTGISLSENSDRLQISTNDSEIDHGSLAGLEDDDHAQYHNDTRGDARYYTQTQLGAIDIPASGASLIGLDTTNFDHALSSAEDTVQKALDILDESNVVEIGKVNVVGGITKGQAVCITGATGELAKVELADNTIHNCAHTLGIATETKSNNQNIRVIRFGHVINVDTSGFSAGDRLHLITNGNMQAAVSTSGAHIHMGFVVKSDATEGTMLVAPDTYVHDIRGVNDQQVEIACGDDDNTGFIYFQDYSRNNLGFIRGDGLFEWNGAFEISKATPEIKLTDTGDSNSARLVRTDTLAQMNLYNTVLKQTAGNALDFDGNDDYVSVPDSSDWDFGAEDFTISLWVRIGLGAQAQEGILDNYQLAGGNGWLLFHNSGNIYWGWWSSGSFFNPLNSTGVNYRDDTWHHILINNDGGTVKLYIDNSEKDSATQTSIDAATYALNIGTYLNGNQNLIGAMDEIAIWKGSARSVNDISDLWNLGNGLLIDKDDNFPTDGGSIGTDLVALWHHDETAMNQAPGGLDTEDSSANSNHGTAEASMGDEDFVTGKVVGTTGSDIEISGLKIEDGKELGVGGIVTLGDGVKNTKAVIEGGDISGAGIRFKLGSSEVGRFDGATKTFLLNNGVTTAQQAIFRAAASASENITEHQVSDETIVHSISEVGAALFQNFTDSTTGFQIFDKDGGTPIVNVDTTNERVGIGTASPVSRLHISKDFSSPNTGQIVTTIDRTVTGAGVGQIGIGSLMDFRIENAAGALFGTGQWGAFLGAGLDNGTGFAIMPGGNVQLFATYGKGLIGIGLENRNPDAQLDIHINNADTIGQIIKMAVSQSTDALQIQDSSETVGYKINKDYEPEGPKFKITKEGGYAIKLTNKTGSNTVKGQLVQSDTTTDDAFATCGANSDDCIGVVLDAGIPDGSEAWIVISGIADVLMDAGGSVRGDRLITSTTAGSADVWNVGGAVATHFQEIGHSIETRAGAGLARCVLHFN